VGTGSQAGPPRLGYSFAAEVLEPGAASALDVAGGSTRAAALRSDAEVFLASIRCVDAL
jgi:hypothetical protein